MVHIHLAHSWRTNGVAGDNIVIHNVNGVSLLETTFKFSESNIIVLTGKNGAGKTTLAKAFKLLSEPKIFQKTAGLNAVRPDSYISFKLDGYKPFNYSYNNKLNALDTKQAIPKKGEIISELPIPYGERFQQFSLVAGHDAELRANIASDNYSHAIDLKKFLNSIYSSNKFTELKVSKVKKYYFYFILKDDDYYIREDHLSSGEFFLIQLYRLITSSAKLIIIDEFDVALDAAAQVRLYNTIQPILKEYNSRLIVISHSLAFMNTVDDGALYYLEDKSGITTLKQRSFGYIKSDLYGFKGYDRYILTEDPILEGFIEYVIKTFSITPYYQHVTIGVGGDNQLKMLVEKNDNENLFSDSNNVLCIVDGDVYPKLSENYKGPTKIICSAVKDIEMYIYNNRKTLLPGKLPDKNESSNSKKASKTYWKKLTKHYNININSLYKLIIVNENFNAKKLADEIQKFLQ